MGIDDQDFLSETNLADVDIYMQNFIVISEKDLGRR